MQRITVYRRQAVVLFWLASSSEDRLRKAYSRLVDAENER